LHYDFLKLVNSLIHIKLCYNDTLFYTNLDRLFNAKAQVRESINLAYRLKFLTE